MGRILYTDNGTGDLDRLLDSRGLGHAGGLVTLADLPELVHSIAPLWWQTTQAVHAYTKLRGGFSGSVTTGYVTGPDLFADTAARAAQALTDLFASDAARRAAYGDERNRLLTIGFDFMARMQRTTETVTFADGTEHTVEQGTPVCYLNLHEVPTWVARQTFGMLHDRADRATRMSTVAYFEHAQAVQNGVREGLRANGRTHSAVDPTTGDWSTHTGPRADCPAPTCR